jgi:hypothetical protein
MLTALLWIADGVAAMGAFVVFGIETAGNALFVAIAAAATAALALLPSMSDAPALGSPEWLRWLNWFYPVSDLVAGLTAVVGLWVAFLVVRWVLKWTRAL